MLSRWSACPPDLLHQCLDAQKDYTDNAATACVNKLWREVFRSGGHAIDIMYSTLRPLPSVSYSHQFCHLTSVSLRRPPARQFQECWRPFSISQAQHRTARTAWTATSVQVPPTCVKLALNRCFPQKGAATAGSLSQSLSQLTNLQQLTLHEDNKADINLEILSGQTNL